MEKMFLNILEKKNEIIINKNSINFSFRKIIFLNLFSDEQKLRLNNISFKKNYFFLDGIKENINFKNK